MATPILEMAGICKRFPGVVALNNVSFAIEPGEVVALIGENGAGKSTLMKTLGGVHQPNEGTIKVNGQAVTIRSVADSYDLGIGFVHQELNVLDNLDVAGNIFLGREPRCFGPLNLIDTKKLHEQTQPYLDRLSLDIHPGTPLNELSIAQQQMVEIAKALSLNARILIMDEPTSSLTIAETERLMEVVKELRDQGIAIIYISHRLGEVKECASRVVGLRDGQNAGGLSKEEINHDAMVSLMVGRELENFYEHTETEKTPGYFTVTNVGTTAYPTKRVSFDVAKGEILGFAGLVGAGRSELAQTLFGVDQAVGDGTVKIENEIVPLNSCRSAIARGLYLVPEDRKLTGLVLEMTIRENMTLASLPKHASPRLKLIRRAAENVTADEQIQAMKVKTPSAEARVINLSGGNQQKVVLGKWLSMDPKVIIFDEPTRGIDVGAKHEIYRLMHELAAKGCAIIMISSDMEEVLGVSDRIAVMHLGEITGFLEPSEFSEEAVMQLAVGGSKAA